MNGGKRAGAGAKSADVALANDVADDIDICFVAEYEAFGRAFAEAMAMLDEDEDRAWADLDALLARHKLRTAMLHGYAVGLRETPRATPTRDRVYALADARTRKAALAARTANAA